MIGGPVVNWEIVKEEILLCLLPWPDSWFSGMTQDQGVRQFFLPMSVTEWIAARKTVPQWLDRRFCFRAVDLASSLTVFQDRSAAKRALKRQQGIELL